MSKKRWWIALYAAAALCMTGCGSDGNSVPAARTTVRTESTKVQIIDEAEKLAAEVTRTKQDLEKAQTEMNSCDQELRKAQQAFQDAESSLESYKTEHADIVPFIGQGTLGFFGYNGSESAVDVLKNAKYASSTKIGAPNDATSLENMNQVFSHLKNCNIVRDGMDVGKLKVTDRLMAIAESNLNWTDEHMESSGQFEETEIYVFDSSNPYQTWYDDEKEEEGEHYKIVLNENYKLTGFAYCNANRSGDHEFAHLQVFSGKNDEPSYTVEEYEERFEAFCKAASEAEAELKTRTDAMNAAKKTMDELQQKYDSAKEAFEKANKLYLQAEKVYNWYT